MTTYAAVQDAQRRIELVLAELEAQTGLEVLLLDVISADITTVGDAEPVRLRMVKIETRPRAAKWGASA